MKIFNGKCLKSDCLNDLERYGKDMEMEICCEVGMDLLCPLAELGVILQVLLP